MIDWYAVPIAERVKPFLKDNQRIWFTVGGIAARIHVPEWQVEQQVEALMNSGDVESSTDRDGTFYRVKELKG